LIGDSYNNNRVRHKQEDRINFHPAQHQTLYLPPAKIQDPQPATDPNRPEPPALYQAKPDLKLHQARSKPIKLLDPT